MVVTPCLLSSTYQAAPAVDLYHSIMFSKRISTIYANFLTRTISLGRRASADATEVWESKMDPMHMPLITYFVDWRNVGGTYILGILGVIVCLAACITCWHQIKNDPGA
jgi:hypothetical protein